MWIARPNQIEQFKSKLIELKNQVLILRGARQVGKSSFALKALDELSEYPNIKLNLLRRTTAQINGVEYYGRDFFGTARDGSEFIHNLNSLRLPQESNHPELARPVLVFVDEVDRYPLAMEAIQPLAEYSDQYKFLFTGSNLENIFVSNAATGRKVFFDLFPIRFLEFLSAYEKERERDYIETLSVSASPTEYFHSRCSELLSLYMRLGGMPKILTTFLEHRHDSERLASVTHDLVFSIEENVKTVLGDKSSLYEYEDVLRTLARHSMNTLKFSRLQVDHAGRAEAKKIVSKTVGARVAHKIRLWEQERDLSKYILFDLGVCNYLLGGSNLLTSRWSESQTAIQYETFIGNALIQQLTTRDDLHYWKSGNRAEVEFTLRAPYFLGIDVKSKSGNLKSLSSMAIAESNLDAIIKIDHAPPSFQPKYRAKIDRTGEQRLISLITVPHYLAPRLLEVVTDSL
jgi:predicted AAA+ superfamily ATPase